MAATTYTWNTINSSQTDGDSPLDETLMEAIRQNLVSLEEWLGDGYAQAKDHTHSGVDSALISTLGANVINNSTLFDAAVGSLLYHSNDTSAADSGSSLQKVREITVAKGGTYTVKFDLRRSGANTVAYAQLKINGVNNGAEQSTTSTSFVTKSVNAGPTNAGDTIELWIRTQSGSPDTEVQDFRLYVGTLLDTPKNTL